MIKLDLSNLDDVAIAGCLLSYGIYPIQGSNFITADGKREHFAFFPDTAKPYLKDIEETKEYRAAYLTSVFIDESRKQVPLVAHKLSNEKEIIVPANYSKEQILELIHKAK